MLLDSTSQVSDLVVDAEVKVVIQCNVILQVHGAKIALNDDGQDELWYSM